MLVQLEINDNSIDLFMKHIGLLQDNIVKNIFVSKKSFELNTLAELQKRIQKAETRSDFVEHNIFWDSRL
jgi:hypothetical protein